MIKFVRVDYRLLHGQVVFAWVGNIGVNRIIIVDDKAATNEIQKTALRLARPTGVKLDIVTKEQVAAISEKIETLNESIMMIAGGTETALFLSKTFKTIQSINYGAIENKSGAKQFSRAIFLTEKEVSETKEILEQGTEIFVQQVPTDKRINMLDLI